MRCVCFPIFIGIDIYGHYEKGILVLILYFFKSNVTVKVFHFFFLGGGDDKYDLERFTKINIFRQFCRLKLNLQYLNLVLFQNSSI